MGLFEKAKGSGQWWIRYADQYGHIHREKVGPKSLAQKAYEKPRHRSERGCFFPKS